MRPTPLPLPALPQPIPYQGSKRLLAPTILSLVVGRRFATLYEPFAGSAAITLAAAHLALADHFVLSDSLVPLMGIWRSVVGSPHQLADAYEQIWTEQLPNPARFYARARDEFNADGGAAKLLYLLARCVKNAPRFNRDGGFNQSADHRRLGMRPAKMRREITGASALLAGRTTISAGDFETAIALATPDDLVYLDPPYMGTSSGRDRRYHRGLDRERLIAALDGLNRRGVPFLLSYDGRCGNTVYGPPLPASLEMEQIELRAGRSSQATLLGRSDVTFESLYVSKRLLLLSASARTAA